MELFAINAKLLPSGKIFEVFGIRLARAMTENMQLLKKVCLWGILLISR